MTRTGLCGPAPADLSNQFDSREIEALYTSWTQVLRNARGVYLLVRRNTGEQYVGSAGGADGWLGGKLAMRELADAAVEYDVTILEVAGSSATIEDIYLRESLWKTKLGTRVVGVNRN